MEDGAVAIPEDPAGEPITGGRPAPGPQRGEPTGAFTALVMEKFFLKDLDSDLQIECTSSPQSENSLFLLHLKMQVDKHMKAKPLGDS